MSAVQSKPTLALGFEIALSGFCCVIWHLPSPLHRRLLLLQVLILGGFRGWVGAFRGKREKGLQGLNSRKHS